MYSNMKLNLNIYDTSDYPSNHPLYSTHNKKVIGKFEDELNGTPGIEFVGLNAKMYSLNYEQGVKKQLRKSLRL